MIIAYFDLFSGVSGDMFLSAFVDAGLPQNLLKENLQYILSANEYKIDFKTIQSHGISGKQVDISENPLTSRSYSKIINSIQNSKLDKHIKEISKKFLKTLALAEAKIHSLPLEKVHFHEIGAVDTIIDIVGIATAIEYFKIDKVFISDIPVGSGEINCLHGTFPNPAPATSEMLKGFNVRKLDINAELTTPTGVAVLKGVNAVQSELPVFKLENIGYGFGKQKITDRPNFLRILIGKAETDKTFCNSNIYEIEFNVEKLIDNCIKKIDDEVIVGPIRYEYEKAKIDVQRSEINAVDGVNRVERLVNVTFDLPDIVSFLAKETKLKRKDIIRILTGTKKLNHFKNNPQRFIEEVLRVIKEEMNKLIVEGVKYEKINLEYAVQEIFDKEEIVAYMKNLAKSDKSVYDYTICDSEIEKKFVEEFDKNENVKLFAKLPSNFKVNTPIGSYNPDFAIVVEINGEEKLYFVLESKGSISKEDRRGKENYKIDCAEKHFEVLSKEHKDLKYVVEKDFKGLKSFF